MDKKTIKYLKKRKFELIGLLATTKNIGGRYQSEIDEIEDLLLNELNNRRTNTK